MSEQREGDLMRHPERSQAQDRRRRHCPSRYEPAVAFERVVVGTVARLSASSFTVTTGAGQVVTMNRHSSTAYWKAGSPASSRAVSCGDRVAVLATPVGTTMSAAAVAILPTQVWL